MQKLILDSTQIFHVADQEAYKELRTNLLCCEKEMKVILFTSAQKGDGKTTVSLELALSLSEVGRKVLYFDCDIRQLGLIEEYNLNGKVNGVTNFLTNSQLGIEDIIYETNVKNFYMTFSGPIFPNPTELLERPAFGDFMKYAREKFDYVMVDTPALGVVIDGMIIARECDGAVLVVPYQGGKRKEMINMIKQLKKTGTPVLGAVLNKVPEKGL